MSRSLFIPLFYFIIMSLFSSCMFMGSFFGISHPHTISEKKLQRKIDKYELTPFYHLNVTEMGYWNYFEKAIEKGIYHGIHSTIVFKDGKLILPMEESYSCSSHTLRFIASLKDTSIAYQVIDSVHLDDFIDKRFIVEYDRFVETDTATFVILLHWATFAGVGNRIHTKSETVEIQNDIDSGLDASVYYINLDVKEDWSVSKIRYNLKPDSVNNFIFIREDKYKKD